MFPVLCVFVFGSGSCEIWFAGKGLSIASLRFMLVLNLDRSSKKRRETMNTLSTEVLLGPYTSMGTNDKSHQSKYSFKPLIDLDGTFNIKQGSNQQY